MNDNRIPDEPILTLIPLDVRFPDEAHHGLQQQHDHLEELFPESNIEINSLFNPEIQPVYQDPFIQLENNTPRWIQLSGGEVMFTNGRLDESNSHDQPESSAMGELRAPESNSHDLPLCIEFCLQQEANNTNEGDANEGQLNHTSPLGPEENNPEAENDPPTTHASKVTHNMPHLKG